MQTTTGFSDSKNHYLILDSLRGVAAILVVMFHLLETFAMGNNHNQIINHGYLAVDFFFLLSGFVIGYAYDDRRKTMSLGNFFKRRLIRLHPMIILGMLIGGATFYFQGSSFFPGIPNVPVADMLLVMVIGMTLIPVGKSMDVRGWEEMHPLNGPAWSLFFEYIANILYALVFRHLSTKILSILVAIAGIALTHLAISRGDVIGGWSIDSLQLQIGFTRLLFPFLAGLLLSRVVKPGTIRNAFVWSSLILIVVLSIPRLGGTDHQWINGLYVAFSIIVVFPLVVYLGASGTLKGKKSQAIGKFFGDISYPLYITHYPLNLLFMAWVDKNQVSLTEALPMAFGVLIASVALAYGSFRLFDLPLRNWLSSKFLTKKR